jgi:arginine decarboxylase
MEKFIDLKDVRDELPFHEPRGGEAYYVAFFLTGAYQDILGMRHNLFGAPNEAHIVVHEDDTFKVQHLVKGDTVDHVLRSVHYDPDVLIQGPQTKRKTSPKSDAAEALRALLTEERKLHTYLEI